MDRHIFLVGMPGSGKSALGRRVAAKLQMPYLDTDVYLTETTGMNTAQLYRDVWRAGLSRWRNPAFWRT